MYASCIYQIFKTAEIIQSLNIEQSAESDEKSDSILAMESRFRLDGMVASENVYIDLYTD
jgi:hypothetical protein